MSTIAKNPSRPKRSALCIGDPVLAGNLTTPLYQAHSYLAYNLVSQTPIASCYFPPDDVLGCLPISGDYITTPKLYVVTNGPALPDSTTRRLMFSGYRYCDAIPGAENPGKHIWYNDPYSGGGSSYVIWDEGEEAGAVEALYYGMPPGEPIHTTGCTESELATAGDYDVTHDGTMRCHSVSIYGVALATATISYVPWAMGDDDFLMDKINVATGRVGRGWINDGDPSIGDLIHALGPSSGAGALTDDLMSCLLASPYFQVCLPRGQWHDNTSAESILSDADSLKIPIGRRTSYSDAYEIADPAIVLHTSGYTSGCTVTMTSNATGDVWTYTTVAGDAYSSGWDDTPNFRTVADGTGTAEGAGKGLRVFGASLTDQIEVEIECESGVELLWYTVALFPHNRYTG